MGIFDVVREIEEWLWLIMAFLSGLLVRGIYKRSQANASEMKFAKKRFRDAFQYERILFDESTEGIDRHTNRLALVENMHSRHARAVDDFIPYLSKRKELALKKAWLNYKNYIDKYNLVGWFDANGLYYSTDAGRDHKRNARELLHKVLSFVKD